MNAMIASTDPHQGRSTNVSAGSSCTGDHANRYGGTHHRLRSRGMVTDMKRLIKGIGRQELRTEARTQVIAEKLDRIADMLQPSAPDEFAAPHIPDGSICATCEYRHTRRFTNGGHYIRCSDRDGIHSVANGAAIHSCRGHQHGHMAQANLSIPDHRVVAGPANPNLRDRAENTERAVVYATPRESLCRTCVHGTRLVRSSVNPRGGIVCHEANRRIITSMPVQNCTGYRAF